MILTLEMMKMKDEYNWIRVYGQIHSTDQQQHRIQPQIQMKYMDFIVIPMQYCVKIFQILCQVLYDKHNNQWRECRRW